MPYLNEQKGTWKKMTKTNREDAKTKFGNHFNISTKTETKKRKRKKRKKKSQFLPRFAIVQTKLEEKIERHCKEKVWLLEKFTTYV